ncbi:anti-sigma factor family protein [Streptomyces sp. NPDC014991]|uniref:anti-sigma factor family protein n=1 Tax=Streptomyces sp. NPDC014991 TaxID=3364935 RepID=UPI0036FA27BF
MTSRTDTAGHPDVAEISDLTEGLLAPDRSTDVRRHLGTCEACADMYASLEEIRSLLGSVPESERMPDDVAERIDIALAAGAPPRAGGEVTAGHVSRETAPVVHRPGGRPRATTGPGRKPSERGRRRGRFVLGAVLTAAVLGGGGLVVTSLGDNSGDTTAHGTPTTSAGAFSGDSVQNQVHGLLATKKGLPQDSEKPRLHTEGGSDTPGATRGPNTLIQTAVPVPDCVRQALSRGADVLGAKTGTYAGKSAYLVVVADAHDSKRVTAYVVDEACVRQRSTAAGEVLLKQSVVRP